MARGGDSVRVMTSLVVLALLLVLNSGCCSAQWSQTNGWGGAGVGKRDNSGRLSKPCTSWPILSLILADLDPPEREKFLIRCFDYAGGYDNDF